MSLTECLAAQTTSLPTPNQPNSGEPPVRHVLQGAKAQQLLQGTQRRRPWQFLLGKASMEDLAHPRKMALESKNTKKWIKFLQNNKKQRSSWQNCIFSVKWIMCNKNVYQLLEQSWNESAPPTWLEASHTILKIDRPVFRSLYHKHQPYKRLMKE